MSPALNGSSAIWHFQRSNVIEIRDGIPLQFLHGTATYICTMTTGELRMGHALDTRIHTKNKVVLIGPKGQMKHGLHTYDALCYTHVTAKSAIVGVAIDYG